MTFRCNPHNYYKELSYAGKLWIPKQNAPPFTHHYTDKAFSSFPVNGNDYVKHIKPWYCKMKDVAEGKALETKIQVVFSRYFHIGYYTGYKQSWLGKVESKPAEIAKKTFTFHEKKRRKLIDAYASQRISLTRTK